MVVLLFLIMPYTSAVEGSIQTNSIKNDLNELLSMDFQELSRYIEDLFEDEPALISNIIEQAEDEDLIEDDIDELLDSNETFLEKIWLRVFNYRAFRLYISICLYGWFKSKLTLMRTMTWGIKTLRWIKVGIILGIIDPTPQPITPKISFVQSMTNKTLTVVAVEPEDVNWSDIDNVGSGSCDPIPMGNVIVGDKITNCTGIIVLRYKPTNEVMGIFEFN